MNYQNNRQFSTKDRDNDDYSSDKCAEYRHGGFWYNACAHANLNGEYLRNGMISKRGINWSAWKKSYYSLKRVEMKIKPN